jgi:hypothetical protein
MQQTVLNNNEFATASIHPSVILLTVKHFGKDPTQKKKSKFFQIPKHTIQAVLHTLSFLRLQIIRIPTSKQ